MTGKIPESALSVIDLEAAESEAPVSHLGEDYRVTYHRPDEIWGEWFDFENDRGKIKRTENADDWSTPTRKRRCRYSIILFIL